MSSNPHIKEVDNLRAVAIVMTLVAHLGFFTHENNEWYAYVIQNVAQFWGGVDLFFVISGFVISKQLHALLRVGDGWSANTDGLKIFFVKRFFRIFPQAFFWAAVVLFFSWYFQGVGKFGDVSKVIWHFGASILSVENIYLTFDVIPQLSIYWSLSIEEQFYIIFPLLLIFLPRKKVFAVLLVAAVVQLLLPRPVDQSKIIFMVRYDALILGCFIYLWTFTSHYLNVRGRLANRSQLLFAVQILLLLAIMAIPVHMRGVWFMVGVLDICCCLIVAISVLQLKAFEFRAWAGKVFGYLGKRSYAIYLCHIPVAFLLLSADSLLGTHWAPQKIMDYQIFGTIVLIFVAAEMSYQLIEKPLRERGRVLAQRWQGAARTVPV
ncbi:acyltransferase [Acidovorax sp. BLS4]|uniref:acyltransferase family protein n=1 Tax=Acidovorax sp. BLS4 TaxID=3273430 RepID=UPI00294366E8|nr:acyltransferase [Paracidovorax avenae]WOI44033.1 acyltransferase [Paracidovorax avenae]